MGLIQDLRCQRVGISLQHPERGPFLVVTRDGHFVTCLGEGMEPTGLPVITRGQLDGIAAKAEDIRARLVECQKLIGERGGMGQLLKRLYDAGNGTMSLAALGLRHARLRAEVEKTLQAPRSYEYPLIRSICEPILDGVFAGVPGSLSPAMGPQARKA